MPGWCRGKPRCAWFALLALLGGMGGCPAGAGANHAALGLRCSLCSAEWVDARLVPGQLPALKEQEGLKVPPSFHYAVASHALSAIASGDGGSVGYSIPLTT